MIKTIELARFKVVRRRCDMKYPRQKRVLFSRKFFNTIKKRDTFYNALVKKYPHATITLEIAGSVEREYVDKIAKESPTMQAAINGGGCPIHGIDHLVYGEEAGEIILQQKNNVIIESKFSKPLIHKSVVYCNAHLTPEQDISPAGGRYNDKRGFAMCGYSFEKQSLKKVQ